MSSYDAIVIGSGPGGLTCAAHLAASGKRVIVLEQHDLAGGNCMVFRRQNRYEFDVGLHYIGDCGPGGLFPAIFGGLGLGDRITFRPFDSTFDHLHFPDKEILVPAGWPEYRETLVEAFPEEEEGIGRCLSILEAIATELRSALLPDAETPTLREWGHASLQELYDNAGLSSKAQAVLSHWTGLYGSGPDASSVTMHASIIDHYMRGAFYPEGGGQVIPARLVEVIEALGGEVRTMARVERITTDNGRVTGAVLDGGEEITAPLVVSNADYKRTVLELTDPEAWRSETVERAQSMVTTLGLVIVYLVVEGVLDGPNCNYFSFPSWDLDDAYQTLEDGELPDGRVPFAYIAMASRKDPDNHHLCPPGHTNFQIMSIAPRGYDFWGVDEGPTHGESYRRVPRYREMKDEVTEQLLDLGEGVLGPFRDRIVHMETATPLSQERYTLSTDGTSYGLQHSPEQVGKSRPGYRTEVDGLFLVGQNTVSGHGIAGAMVGGVRCAGEILGKSLLVDSFLGTSFVDPAILPEDPDDWDPVAVSRGRALREKRAGRA